MLTFISVAMLTANVVIPALIILGTHREAKRREYIRRTPPEGY